MADTAGRECLQAGICISHAGRTAAMISCSRAPLPSSKCFAECAYRLEESYPGTHYCWVVGSVLAYKVGGVVPERDVSKYMPEAKQGKLAVVFGYSKHHLVHRHCAIAPPPRIHRSNRASMFTTETPTHPLAQPTLAFKQEKKEPDDSLSNSAVPPFH